MEKNWLQGVRVWEFYQHTDIQGEHENFKNSPRKWPNSHSQKLFLRNDEIVYYQDILQLPVPLNTLHTMDLNAKSHNLL